MKGSVRNKAQATSQGIIHIKLFLGPTDKRY
jgi:hypothetical protein